MTEKKNILIIIGSASDNSANLKLMEILADIAQPVFNVTIFNSLKSLPHFDPELSTENPPAAVVDFRNSIAASDGIIICTPEYVFSLPAGLKNAIEWCIATTVFMDKPTGIITASASGEKGHEALQLVMKTAMAKFVEATTLLIQGIKGKFDSQNSLTDTETFDRLKLFIIAFESLMK
jgi:NAD(P)H-dependent FMN reductase